MAGEEQGLMDNLMFALCFWIRAFQKKIKQKTRSCTVDISTFEPQTNIFRSVYMNSIETCDNGSALHIHKMPSESLWISTSISKT